MNYDYTKSYLLRTIDKYVKGKEVLDVGCTGHRLDTINRNTFWIHDFLVSKANNVMGIDIDKKNVDYLNNKGYNLIEGNAENFKLKKKVDTIFAGELIEHVNNPGLFLECCKKNLKDNGRLIITTPNAFSISNLLFVIFRRNSNIQMNQEHTMLFTPQLLEEIGSRQGFEAEVRTFFQPYVFRRWFMVKVREIVHKIVGKPFETSILFVLKLKNSEEKSIEQDKVTSSKKEKE